MPAQGASWRTSLTDGGWMFIILSIFMFMTARDIFPSGSSRVKSDTNDVDQVSMPISGSSSSPVVKFYFCYSCGYAKAYQEYEEFIKERYPDILISGENYKPNIIRSLLANGLNILRMAILGLVIFNKNPFEYFGMATPNLWNWLMGHKISGCLMIFFMINAIEAQLLTSGAFEIYFNDIQIWSKLETGRIPTRAELSRILDNHMPSVEPTITPEIISFDEL